MSDITSLNNMAGANPALAKSASGARPAPEPPTVQNAVAQPLNTAQSAVTQSPTAGQVEWKRKAEPDGRQQSSQTGAVPTQQQVAQTVDHLNRRMSEYNTNLQFEINDTYHQVVIRIVDRESKEVVRQIPSETALALAQFFDDLAVARSQTRPNPSGGDDGKPFNAEGLLLQVTV